MGKGLSQLVFQPPDPSYVFQPPDVRCVGGYPQHIEITSDWLTTERGEIIAAEFIRNRDAHFTVLFSHGNAEDLGFVRDDFILKSMELQVNILIYDYSGYGRSTGTPTESNVYADIMAAYKFLRDTLQIPWQRIVLMGRSLGTAPCTYLASRTPVRGVILQSPMLSIYRVPFKLRFTLPGDLMCNCDRVRQVRCPMLIMHGMRDELVPWWHGYRLYELRRRKGLDCEKFIVPHADHNNFEQQAGDEYKFRMEAFLIRLMESPESDELRMQPQIPADALGTRNAAGHAQGAARRLHAQGALVDTQMASSGRRQAH